jgi:hypothetical protein
MSDETAIETAVNIAVLEEKVEQLTTRVVSLEESLEEMVITTNRWKGGAAALVLIGTFFGAILANLEHLKAFLGFKI